MTLTLKQWRVHKSSINPNHKSRSRYRSDIWVSSAFHHYRNLCYKDQCRRMLFKDSRRGGDPWRMVKCHWSVMKQRTNRNQLQPTERFYRHISHCRSIKFRLALVAVEKIITYLICYWVNLRILWKCQVDHLRFSPFNYSHTRWSVIKSMLLITRHLL